MTIHRGIRKLPPGHLLRWKDGRAAVEGWWRPCYVGDRAIGLGEAVEELTPLLRRVVSDLMVSDVPVGCFLSGGIDSSVIAAFMAETAKAAGVPVYGLFLGDTERTVTLAIDGRDEVMKAERATLDQLATGTGAISVNATTTDEDVRALVEHISAGVAQRPWEERQRVVASERYQWLLLPAILLLTAGALLPTRRRIA